MTTYIVQFDKTYLDGTLAGLLITGNTCSYSTRNGADRHAAWLRKVEAEDDFIRAAVTGNRYKVANVSVYIEPARN